jgi:hypothetical protein
LIFTYEQLKQMQAWPHSQKIQTSQSKILEFCIKNDFNISVSFSGGADSTVLMDLICRVWDFTRDQHKDKPLLVIYANTSNEFITMKKHVEKMKIYFEQQYNIIIDLQIVSPKDGMSYDKVVKEIGYPIASKKIARMVRDVRTFFKNSDYKYEDIKDKIDEGVKSAEYLRSLGFPPTVVLRLTGITRENNKSNTWRIPKKWRKLIIAPFEVSEECCSHLKKEPLKLVQKQFKACPIFGTLAEDSQQREGAYLETGCNLYRSNGKNQSTPMGFWLRQDVLKFLYEMDTKYQEELPILKEEFPELAFPDKLFAPPYGELMQNEDNTYEFTGEHNTGCKLCLFGCHMEKEPNRIQRLKNIEPATYNYAIRPFEEKGLNYKMVMEYCGIPWE